MKEKKNINIEIGGRIKKAREAAGLTQERFAELIQLGTKNVSAIERGVVGISLTTVQRICQVLSISSDMLFFDNIEMNNEVQVLTERLDHLSPEQFEIAKGILNKLFEAFTLDNKK
jgi:transcriptional regulator with XRE-family HTH domain